MTVDHLIFDNHNPLEDVLKAFISFFNWVSAFINKLLGVVGLVVLAPALGLLAFTLWVTIKIANRQLDKLIKKIFRDIDTSDVRSLMILHAAIKNKRKVVELGLKSMKPSNTLWISRPIVGQINYSYRLYKEAEDRLHKAACPHLYVPYTEEQINQMKLLSKEFEGVWASDDYVNS